MPAPGESWSHEIAVKLRQRIRRKHCEVLVVANMLLLLATHCYQSINKDTNDVFQGHDMIKWIYYTSEILCVVSHLILLMELRPCSVFRYAKTIFETLGFEMLLWVVVSYDVWVFINAVILYVALLCALGPECLRIQPIDSYSHDDESMSKVAGLAENGLDGDDLA